MTQHAIGNVVTLKDDVLTYRQERQGIVTGYFKVLKARPITCPIVKELIEEEIAEDKRNGNYVEKVRIFPCSQSEATVLLICGGLTSSFLAADYFQAESLPSSDPEKVEIAKSLHDKRLSSAQSSLLWGDGTFDHDYKVKKTFVVAE